MALAPLKLTRDQFATFLENQEQIKQFENLLLAVNQAILNAENANLVFAGPASGVAAPPSFRALVPNDIPPLDYVESVGATAPITSTGGFNPVIGVTGSALTKTDDTNVTLSIGGSPNNALLAAVSLALGWTGNLSVLRGGTGQTSYVDGELLIGNSTGNTLTKATLTAGTNVSIVNGPGTVTINATPPTGVSATITTAQLTPGGTQGSMTFVNGILTAQTPAT
jgi:hypothetical protein